MGSMKRYKDIKFEGMSAKEFSELPNDYAAAWMKRPRNNELKSAEKFMYFRASLITAWAIYLMWNGSWSDLSWIVFVLAGYETAYYTHVERCLSNKYFDDMDKHNKMVAELDKKYFGIVKEEDEEEPYASLF